MRAKYPLAEHARDQVRSRSGKTLEEITLEELAAGNLEPDDLTIHADNLSLQAQVAEEHGYPQVGENLRRAAELSHLPDERVLAIYEALRPYRTSTEQLEALALELEQLWQAPENARLVRQAAEVYRRQKLV